MRKYIIIFIIFFICLFSILFLKSNKIEAIYTNSTPVTSHVVVIDAGHGKPDEGINLLVLNK